MYTLTYHVLSTWIKRQCLLYNTSDCSFNISLSAQQCVLLALEGHRFSFLLEILQLWKGAIKDLTLVSIGNDACGEVNCHCRNSLSWITHCACSKIREYLAYTRETNVGVGRGWVIPGKSVFDHGSTNI